MSGVVLGIVGGCAILTALHLIAAKQAETDTGRHFFWGAASATFSVAVASLVVWAVLLP